VKEPRFDVIQRVLRTAQPVRPLLAYELRGPIVQLLASGTTDPTWQAPPGLLAQAIVKALIAAEEKDIPTGSTGTAFTPHALVIELDGLDFRAVCRCSRAIGRTPQGRPVDGLVGLWEQHIAEADPDSTWKRAVAALPATPIGAS
jgi:hypothetical protein